MNRSALFAAVALSGLSPWAQAAEWNLTFEANYVLWAGDAATNPLTDLQLLITTEDQVSTSSAVYNLGDGYKITGFTGTRNGQAITALLSPTDTDFFYFGVDNYLYASDPQIVGGAGLAYQTADGTEYNLYGYTATFLDPAEVQWWELSSALSASPYSPNVTFNGNLTLTPAAAAVPEPASWALLLGGMGLLARLAARKTRR